jgi:alkyl hydroperoxide reductase subunit AhpC
MTTTEIKQLFSEIQKKLEKLQNEHASFLFLSDEGNKFCMGGNTTRIMAQITFAMMHYPVVRDIIKDCAEKYDLLNATMGDDARNVKLDYLIEQNSGRK